MNSFETDSQLIYTNECIHLIEYLRFEFRIFEHKSGLKCQTGRLNKRARE